MQSGAGIRRVLSAISTVRESKMPEKERPPDLSIVERLGRLALFYGVWNRDQLRQTRMLTGIDARPETAPRCDT
jgi:hypothetical protein